MQKPIYSAECSASTGFRCVVCQSGFYHHTFVMAYWIIGPTGGFADSFVSLNDTIFMNLLKVPQGKLCLDGCAWL